MFLKINKDERDDDRERGKGIEEELGNMWVVYIL